MVTLHSIRLRTQAEHVLFYEMFRRTRNSSNAVKTVLLAMGIPTSKHLSYGGATSNRMYEGTYRKNQQKLRPHLMQLQLRIKDAN